MKLNLFFLLPIVALVLMSCSSTQDKAYKAQENVHNDVLSSPALDRGVQIRSGIVVWGAARDVAVFVFRLIAFGIRITLSS